MTKITGKEVNLYVYRSGSPVFVACATNLSIQVESEIIAITTVDSGLEDEYEGGATNANIDLSGVGVMDELSAWQYEDFIDNIGTKQRVIVIFTNSYGDVLSYDMYVIVKSVGSQSDAKDYCLFDVSMIRSGAMTKLKTYDNILIDGLGNPILDGNGDLIRTN